MLEKLPEQQTMAEFWPTQFHCYGGNNLITTQCLNITGNKNVPYKLLSEHQKLNIAHCAGTTEYWIKEFINYNMICCYEFFTC